ncbi:MAG: GNAT family N-acetyltransferase [Endozoicomonas sp.]
MSEDASLTIQSVPSTKAPFHLLLEADPSESKVRNYLEKSRCYVAETAGRAVGVYVLQPVSSSVLELMNIAVDPEVQASGIGSTLLRHAIATARNLGAKKLALGTGSFGYQLSFYQKAGFRVESVDRDFFLKNYDEPIFENGIQHKDMLRLGISL